VLSQPRFIPFLLINPVRLSREMESIVRRLLASFAVALLVAAGLTVTAGGAAQATETTFGTITGTVSFATAPSWDNGDRNFTVALVDYYGNVVPTNLVPISYDYDGGSGFTITYPNSDGDYNNWFRPGSYSYTVAIYPSDEEYPPHVPRRSDRRRHTRD